MSLRTKKPAQKKILIANSHALMRERLGRVIADISDLALAAEAKNGDEVIEMIEKCTIDLVILDIDMPGRNALEILGEIKSNKPALPVLMSSMFPEKHYVQSMLMGGADGYIALDDLPYQMIEAIHWLFQGRKYFGASLLKTLSVHPGLI
jgi:two-component system, NarL family, invasion response regulator UvrY